jgi:hypothetical protein
VTTRTKRSSRPPRWADVMLEEEDTDLLDCPDGSVWDIEWVYEATDWSAVPCCFKDGRVVGESRPLEPPRQEQVFFAPTPLRTPPRQARNRPAPETHSPPKTRSGRRRGSRDKWRQPSRQPSPQQQTSRRRGDTDPTDRPCGNGSGGGPGGRFWANPKNAPPGGTAEDSSENSAAEEEERRRLARSQRWLQQPPSVLRRRSSSSSQPARECAPRRSAVPRGEAR